jgi:GGDEF domain-containing protein
MVLCREDPHGGKRSTVGYRAGKDQPGSCFAEPDQTMDDMIKQADDALYSSKNERWDYVEWTPRS